jgi:hypothetical protein
MIGYLQLTDRCPGCGVVTSAYLAALLQTSEDISNTKKYITDKPLSMFFMTALIKSATNTLHSIV